MRKRAQEAPWTKSVQDGNPDTTLAGNHGFKQPKALNVGDLTCHLRGFKMI
jgi:hypothetical protein